VPHEWVLEMDEAWFLAAAANMRILRKYGGVQKGTGACGIFNRNCGSFHNMNLGKLC
jgi:hypothetical protein